MSNEIIQATSDTISNFKWTPLCEVSEPRLVRADGYSLWGLLHMPLYDAMDGMPYKENNEEDDEK